MDLTGISKSILSISSPGTNVASDVALNETVIRATNDSAANIRRLSPTHFGCFAALPLADIPSSIAESAYTIDALNADGFVLHSSIINIYLSNPILQAVLAELNEGNAIAFIHPTVTYHYAPVTMYALPAERYAASSSLANHHRDLLFESFFDSTRSILDLIGSATILHFPGIRWVIPYCGDVLSSLLNRSFLILRLGQPSTSTRFCLPITEEEIKAALKGQFWVDLAEDRVPNLVDVLLKLTGKERLVFGSDVPWAPFKVTRVLIKRIERDLPGRIGGEVSGGSP